MCALGHLITRRFFFFFFQEVEREVKGSMCVGERAGSRNRWGWLLVKMAGEDSLRIGIFTSDVGRSS